MYLLVIIKTNEFRILLNISPKETFASFTGHDAKVTTRRNIETNLALKNKYQIIGHSQGQWALRSVDKKITWKKSHEKWTQKHSRMSGSLFRGQTLRYIHTTGKVYQIDDRWTFLWQVSSSIATFGNELRMSAELQGPLKWLELDQNLKLSNYHVTRKLSV